MRCGGWAVSGLAGCMSLLAGSGCISMEDHNRLKAVHRTLMAEKQSLAQELFDSRNNNDSLRTRFEARSRELETTTELLANLRGENDLLDEIRLKAQQQLEAMAGRQRLGDISISGPKLPETLHVALKGFADANPGTVQYDAAHGTVKWKSDLLFALGSDIVKESSTGSLRGFTQIIMSPAAADFEAIVVGHTDNTPIVRAGTKAKHPTNWHLSAHRAISVGSVLRQYGYTANRIGVMGYGEYRPVAGNSDETGKSQNRRVEIYLVPKGAIVEATASAATPGAGEALANVRP